jgi:ribonuclease HI
MSSGMNEKKQNGLFDDELPTVQANLSAVMYCDGACSGNPGKSGIGVVISISDDEGLSGLANQHTISEYIGNATNNIAEYSALIRGLEKAGSLGIKKLKVFLDSELLVRQMNGVYKVKNKNLMVLWNQARDLLKAFDSCSITHVRREFNKEADALAREGVSKG